MTEFEKTLEPIENWIEEKLKGRIPYSKDIDVFFCAALIKQYQAEQLILSGVSNSLVADIRNKLTPINNLIAMIEDANVTLFVDKDKAKFINTEIAKVKYTIEYLSNL